MTDPWVQTSNPSSADVNGFNTWLLPMVGFVLAGGIVAEIINAVIGAVILHLLGLWLAGPCASP